MQPSHSSNDRLRDVVSGIGGGAVMVAAFLTTFLRGRRAHWGVKPVMTTRRFPGDELVPVPAWGWTHGIEIEAPVEATWPWVAQIGADRAGFYSYQWLENLVGCDIRNADRVHPEWQLKQGDLLRLHPTMPGLEIVALHQGRWFLASGAADTKAREAGKPWVATSWLFLLDRLTPTRCRLISRYRIDMSADPKTRLAFGPTLLEPIGFAMDRRMLLGVRERAEGRGRRGRA